MRCGSTIGLAALLTTLAVLPGHAQPADPPAPVPAGAFQRLESARLGTVVRRPAAGRADRVVNALVELPVDPVAAQLRAGSGAPDRRRAERRVKASQDAVLPRLRAAGATPYGRLRTVLNAVQVRVPVSDLAAVRAVPGVQRVQVSRTVHLDNAAAARFTGVGRTWQDLELTGRGQQIAIIDSGIDYTHADFGGPGTVAAFAANDGTVIEPDSFPTAKVTAGFDFVGDDFDPDSSEPAKMVPQPDPDPLDCLGHGSHVAGTAAGSGVTEAGQTYTGPYNRNTLNIDFAVEPGVAPQARLAAYRAFSCTGASQDGALIAALDRAVSDGADVINMSLGTAFGSPNNLLGVAIRTATDAGVLVVAAGGNAGPGAYLTDSPGSLNEVLSVAGVDAEFSRFPGVAITGAVTSAGLNANEVDLAAPINGQLVNAGVGCETGDYAAAAGKIALTVRGVCDRALRAQLGQQAGARAVIMINSSPGLPPLEGPIAGVTIPFVGVDGDEADRFAAAVGQVITLAAGADIPNPDYGRAGPLSSNGPRRLDSAQKPDLAAPGVSIPSGRGGSGTGATRMSGTSMASPHVAGVAALVRQAHPTWTAPQIKAVIMSTGSPGKVQGFDSRRLGVGLVQPRRAAAAQTYAWTPGQLNSLRFGQNQLTGAYRERRTFKITNRSRRAVTYDLRSKLSSGRYGADLDISPRAVTIRPGRTRTVAVTIRLSRTDVARLPGAEANDGGELVSIHGLVEAVPRRSRSGVLPLRISFLFVPIALSDIRSSPVVRPTPAGAYPPIQIRNAGVHTGTADVYAWLLADPAGDAVDPEIADLTNLGVQSLPGEVVGAPATDRLLVFAASLATGTSTHATQEVDVLIDSDGDGFADFITLAADSGLVQAGEVNGALGSFTFELSTENLVGAWAAPAPANGSTVLLPVLASSIRATEATSLLISAAGLTVFDNTLPSDEMDGAALFQPFAPALSQGAQVPLSPGRRASIPAEVDPERLGEQTAAGWLVVSTDDRAGRWEADRVRLISPPALNRVQRTLSLTTPRSPATEQGTQRTMQR